MQSEERKDDERKEGGGLNERKKTARDNKLQCLNRNFEG